MHNYYPNIFSPIRVGNVVLKNRLVSSPSTPHFLQGPEQYPAESLITHYANRARNGAALIVTGGIHGLNAGRELASPGYGWDPFNPRAQQYMGQMVEAIHFYGTKVTANIMARPPEGFDVSAGIASNAVVGDNSVARVGEEMTIEMIEETIDGYTRLAKVLCDQNFDGVFIHMAYRHAVPGRFLSPLTNTRTDEYGGCFENRIRFPLKLFESIKRACGQDFIIEASISGHDHKPGGWTLDDTIRFAAEAEGLLDMMQVRAPEIDPAHPTGFNPEPTPWLYMAEAVKKSNPGIVIEAIGGFLDPDLCEAALREGKADMIGMARSFISNPEYCHLMDTGRADDIIPCIRCNKCHKTAIDDPWISVCSVNPLLGMEHLFPKFISPPDRLKKVAVVGGGPAGMKAAITCAERGHSVTLYEKDDVLGGLLRYTDLPKFKWPERKFKDYLINQVSKSGITVNLNIFATEQLLEDGQYDAVIAAIGSKARIVDIPGLDGANVLPPIDAYWREADLPHKIVVVGSGESGVECGLYLAQQGHEVTVLSRRDLLAPDCYRVHFYSMFLEAVDNEPNLSYILKARCNGVYEDHVTYLDKSGQEHSIPCGAVVAATGQIPCLDEAMSLSSAGKRFYLIGDCVEPGNIQKTMRSAWGIACSI